MKLFFSSCWSRFSFVPSFLSFHCRFNWATKKTNERPVGMIASKEQKQEIKVAWEFNFEAIQDQFFHRFRWQKRTTKTFFVFYFFSSRQFVWIHICCNAHNHDLHVPKICMNPNLLVLCGFDVEIGRSMHVLLEFPQFYHSFDRIIERNGILHVSSIIFVLFTVTSQQWELPFSIFQ